MLLASRTSSHHEVIPCQRTTAGGPSEITARPNATKQGPVTKEDPNTISVATSASDTKQLMSELCARLSTTLTQALNIAPIVNAATVAAVSIAYNTQNTTAKPTAKPVDNELVSKAIVKRRKMHLSRCRF